MIDNGSVTAMLGLEGMAALAVSDGGGELEYAIETTQTTECRGSRSSCPSDDTFLMLFNASWTPQVFTLPSPASAPRRCRGT